MRRPLERIQGDPTVHDHLGDVYLKQGKLKEAINQWQPSLREWETSAKADVDDEVANVTKKARERAGASGPRGDQPLTRASCVRYRPCR